MQLYAQLGKDQGYQWHVVSFAKNGRPIAVPGATSYFVRFTENGHRTTENAGKDINEATVILRRREP